MHSKAELMQRLTEIGIQPSKRFGQNFLVSKHVCESILNATLYPHPEKVFEIGPGAGALTEELLKGKWKVTLIELDSKVADFWTKYVGGKADVIKGDALNFEWDKISNEENNVLVSNLPYLISARLVVELSGVQPTPFKKMVLMFQKEVAVRITAKSDDSDYGFLSIVAQTFWEIKKVCDAGTKDFFPSPTVASRVLQFTPRSVNLDGHGFIKFVKAAFSQPRKKLLSNLNKKAIGEKFNEAFQYLGISESARPQDLDPAKYLKLYQYLTQS